MKTPMLQYRKSTTHFCQFIEIKIRRHKARAGFITIQDNAPGIDNHAMPVSLAAIEMEAALVWRDDVT
jgi:hypothetical protein